MKLNTLTIVGVGLIGGSIGLAAKKRGLAAKILGVFKDHQTLIQCVELGVVDHGFLTVEEAVGDAEVVVVCTPVEMIAGQVLTAARFCKPGTVVTDTGRTKGEIGRGLEKTLTREWLFVGGH